MEKIKGLRWLKCDLHLHTPKSECFLDKEVTPEEYINKVIEEKINVIAITDHNNSGWIDKLKILAIKNNITLFPGVELTCSDSHIHLLILFDIDKTDQDIEDFLIKLGLDRENFGKRK